MVYPFCTFKSESNYTFLCCHSKQNHLNRLKLIATRDFLNLSTIIQSELQSPRSMWTHISSDNIHLGNSQISPVTKSIDEHSYLLNKNISTDSRHVCDFYPKFTVSQFPFDYFNTRSRIFKLKILPWRWTGFTKCFLNV